MLHNYKLNYKLNQVSKVHKQEENINNSEYDLFSFFLAFQISGGPNGPDFRALCAYF